MITYYLLYYKTILSIKCDWLLNHGFETVLVLTKIPHKVILFINIVYRVSQINLKNNFSYTHYFSLKIKNINFITAVQQLRFIIFKFGFEIKICTFFLKFYGKQLFCKHNLLQYYLEFYLCLTMYEFKFLLLLKLHDQFITYFVKT